MLSVVPGMAAESRSTNVSGFDVRYDIDNGDLISAQLDSGFHALMIEIVVMEDGILEISIPRGLLDSKISADEDDIFFVIIDGQESEHIEVNTSAEDRTLLIPFVADEQLIQIFGTDVLTSMPKTDAEPQEQATPTPSNCGPGTISKDGICIPKETTDGDKKGCLIATATFGTELASQVQLLREVRDRVLYNTNSGTTFMVGFNEFYYTFSPTVADLERQNPMLKEAVKITITPLISSLLILDHVNMDSEADVLAYGVGLILLNIGVYFVAPTFLLSKIITRISHRNNSGF